MINCRLSPSLAAMILLYVGILRHLGSGPYWRITEQLLIKNCYGNWWPTLLFVNNYVRPNLLETVNCLNSLGIVRSLLILVRYPNMVSLYWYTTLHIITNIIYSTSKMAESNNNFYSGTDSSIYCSFNSSISLLRPKRQIFTASTI